MTIIRGWKWSSQSLSHDSGVCTVAWWLSFQKQKQSTQGGAARRVSCRSYRRLLQLGRSIRFDSRPFRCSFVG